MIDTHLDSLLVKCELRLAALVQSAPTSITDVSDLKSAAHERNQFNYLDLRDVLQDGIDKVWAAAAKQVKIINQSVVIAAGAYGNRSMLTRAMTELLNNAVKFLPTDRQNLLFQRFKRAVHHGETDPGGVGLGLAFVRVVAQKHGGTIKVRSDAGNSATFSLAIPQNFGAGDGNRTHGSSLGS